MKKVSIFLSLVILFSCSGNHQKQKQITSIAAKTDSTLIKPYLHLLQNASEKEKKFIRDLVYTIENYQNKTPDTTIIVIGRIDADENKDTIQSHVFVFHDTVFVQSTWTRKGEILWEHELKNPYLWISDNEAFEFSKRSIWVTFTIAYKHAVPRLIEKSFFSELQTATKLGLDNLKSNGLQVDEQAYEQYVTDFQSSLIEYDDPEMHPIYIWYEPLKRFVLFWVG
jgi:hypothetical protein